MSGMQFGDPLYIFPEYLDGYLANSPCDDPKILSIYKAGWRDGGMAGSLYRFFVGGFRVAHSL
jgi:hypothetical protein